MTLIDDDTENIYDMIQDNGIYTLLDTLSMPFQDIKGIRCRVNTKRQSLNTAATNRLKILKSFSIPNKCMKIPLRINDWLNDTIDQFMEFRVSY